MKFSVLIPVYNTEKYLNECIDSVIFQTYRDFEIILVDDGSTDESPSICDWYAKEFPEIVKVVHNKYSGQLISRINAAKNSAGDYCVYLDSDDMFMPYTLVKDARTGYETGNIQAVMDGDLDGFINAYLRMFVKI